MFLTKTKRKKEEEETRETCFQLEYYDYEKPARIICRIKWREGEREREITSDCCDELGDEEEEDSEEVGEALSWRSSSRPRYFRALSPESTEVTASAKEMW